MARSKLALRGQTADHQVYTVESVARALEHHRYTGKLRRVEIGFRGDRQRFIIETPDSRDHALTLAEAYGACIGLRAAELAAGEDATFRTGAV